MSNWARTWGRRTQSGEIMFLSYLTIPLEALEAVTGGREHLGTSALDCYPQNQTQIRSRKQKDAF